MRPGFIRNFEGLEIVRKCLVERGIEGKKLIKVEKTDKKWRKVRRKVDEINLRIGRGQKEITKVKKSTGKIPETLVKEVKECYGVKKELAACEEKLNGKLKVLLRNIGNVIDASYFEADFKNSAFPVEKSHFYYRIPDTQILAKQELLSYCFTFLQSQGFEIVQVPFCLKAKLCKLITPSTKFLKVQGSKELVYITNPTQALLLMHYKETIKNTLKISGYGTCINTKMNQQEKISLIIICSLSNATKLFNEVLELGAKFYQGLNLQFSVVQSSANTLKLSKSIQKEFLQNDLKLFSCSNHTDYTSRDLQLKIQSESPNIITASFCNLNTLASLKKF